MKSFKKYLEEKLIIVGKGKKYGQVIFLAGGAASGKSFAVNNFLEKDKFKILNPDQEKELLVKTAKSVPGKYPELQDIDPYSPEGSQIVHAKHGEMRIGSKKRKLLLDPDLKRSELPNLIFDRTFSYPDEIPKMARKLVRVGYRPENIHVVWVLTDFNIALKQNKKRSRNLPDDVIMMTHKGAAINVRDLIFRRTSAQVNGDIYVVLGGAKHTVYGIGPNGKPMDGKEGKPVYIKNFNYLKVKESGKKLDRTGDIARKVVALLNKYVPWGK